MAPEGIDSSEIGMAPAPPTAHATSRIRFCFGDGPQKSASVSLNTHPAVRLERSNRRIPHTHRSHKRVGTGAIPHGVTTTGDSTMSTLRPARTVHPSGWRYRVLWLSIAASLAFVPAGVQGIDLSISVFLEHPTHTLEDLIGASLWGVGVTIFFGAQLVPFALLIGALSAEACLGLSKLLTIRPPLRPRQRRLLIACSAGVTTLAISLIVSAVIALQPFWFYALVFILITSISYRLDTWLNQTGEGTSNPAEKPTDRAPLLKP